MAYNYTTSQTQILSTIQNYTANVVAYDAVHRIVTLDAPVNISLGYNQSVGQISSQYSFVGTITNISQAITTGNNLPTISTDEAGNLCGIFNVPPNTFKTGSRVFRVDNRSNPADPTTATSYAEATFVASGLSEKSASTDFSPSVDASATTFTSVAQTPQTLVSTITTYSPFDPIAQSFLIDKNNYPNGAFLKSVKIFFATKPATNIPVTLSIVGTTNEIPNGSILDYSTVTLTADQVITSSSPQYLDPTTYTEFMFSAPVYIQAGTLYAIILKAASPDYTVYIAQQNSVAIPSTAKALPSNPNPTNTTKIGSAPYVGSLFESQNSITWTPDQSSDLMFVIDQCLFDITQTPQIQFNLLKNLPYRKMGRNDIQYKLDANNVSNLFGNFNNNIRSDAFNITTTDFVPTSTKATYQYSATLANGNIPVGPYAVTPGRYASPTASNISLNDGLGERLLIANSESSFSVTATLASSDPNVSPIISDDGVTLYNIRYMINNMGIQNNVISLVSGGSGYNAMTTSVSISYPDVGSNLALLAANVVNGNVASVYVVSPGSGYLTTPTVTIVDANTTPGTGASAVVYGETGQHGGNSYAKYFTKKVVLTSGNDSGDLRVYYTAYKPNGTDVYVYYKILSSQDTQTFDQGSWQLMTQTTPVVYSTDTSNLIEYEWAPGTGGVADNSISYTSTNGQTYTSFIQFAIKVVMATNDNTQVPFLTDIRAIALPSGTGL